MAVAFRSAVTAAPGSSATIFFNAKPAGLTVGDLMIIVSGTNSGTSTLGAGGPAAAGWTQIGSLQVHGSDNCMACWYKLADAGDVAASDFTFPNTWTTNQGQANLMAAYSGVDGTTPLDGVTPVQGLSGTTATAPSGSITPATAGARCLFILGCDPAVDPITFDANTPVGSAEDAFSQNLLLAAVGIIGFNQPTPGATTITASTSADAYCQTMVALRPAAGGSTYTKAGLAAIGP